MMGITSATNMIHYIHWHLNFLIFGEFIVAREREKEKFVSTY